MGDSKWVGLSVLFAACVYGGSGDGGSGGASPRSDAGVAGDANMASDASIAEQLERYTLEDSERTAEQPYAPGMDLVVDNVNGDIVLEPGEAGVIAATFTPFTYRGHDRESEAHEDLLTGWSGEVLDQGDQLTVVSHQLGDWEEVGTTLTVRVPPEFDGAIRVVNHGAGSIAESDIDLDDGAVASAWSVRMESLGLGLCNLDGAPSIVETYASCRGPIEITNVTDDVTAYSDGLSSDDPFAVRVSFAAISADATGGEIESTQGHVELDLPSHGDFQVTATSNEAGLVNAVALPETCALSGSTLSCGSAGAIFAVSAGTDDSFDPANVNISFNP
jgi:hypothetical protein